MTQRCVLCGNRYAECTHHLIFGNSRRRLSEKDGIVLNLCNECHNMAVKPVDRIHGNSTAERLSKMLGQAIWELDHVTTEAQREDARRAFIGRYGKNYL